MRDGFRTRVARESEGTQEGYGVRNFNKSRVSRWRVRGKIYMENKKEKACEQLFTCAGFFPNDTSLLPRFNDIMKDACRQTDILGLWQNACEDYYIRRYCNDLSATCRLISLEPWRSKNPWSAAKV